jgi:hypothetical protein
VKVEKVKAQRARNKSYVNRGRRAFFLHLLAHGVGTADDVARLVQLPAEVSRRCLSSVPGPLAKKGIIRNTGFVRSSRRKQHATYIQVWELVDPWAAQDWLDSHPDLPDASPCRSVGGAEFNSRPPREDDPGAMNIKG